MIHMGKILPVVGEPDLGGSASVVLHLARCIPEGMNHLLYIGNWFSSLPLKGYTAWELLDSVDF